MLRFARAVAAGAVLAVAPTLALAQGAGPSPAPAPAPAPSPAAAATTSTGDSTSAAPSGAAAPPASAASSASVVPATGYGWSTAPAKPLRRHVRAVRAARQTPDAIMPGFQMLADGTSQLFVELSKPVSYETKTSRGALIFVLKGVRVDRRNNFNPLVTVHFNTPVTSARLVPHGKDLWFVVDLRANVQPTVTMDAAKDGGAILRIDFPSGNFLPGQRSAPAPAPAAPAPPPASSAQ